MLDWIDLAANYEIVLHLLLPEVDVRPIQLRLISDEPDVVAVCREGLSVVLPEVVTTTSEYDYTLVYSNAV
jgi:hypothetical protein